jgi:hypothetical protein
MDRRVWFFLGASVLSYALYPVADPSHRWFTIMLGSIYLVLTVLTWLDSRSRHGEPSWGTGFAVGDVEGDALPEAVTAVRPPPPRRRGPTSRR